MTVEVSVFRGLEIEESALPERAIRALKQAFTYANPDFEKKRRLGLWVEDVPKKLPNWFVENGKLVLPRGATKKVAQVLEGAGVDYAFSDDRVSFEPVDLAPTPRADPYTLFPHQDRIVDAMLPRENCLVRAGTGSGKTIAALELARRTRQPTLVILWSSALVKQWVALIEKRLGWPTKRIGVIDGRTRRLGDITIAMQQSLLGCVEEVAEHFGCVILDEIQRVAARTHSEVVSRLPARYRFGFSDDERRKDRLEVVTHDHLGEVAIEVSTDDLVEAGFLVDVDIVVHLTETRYAPLEKASRLERPKMVGRHWKKIIDTIVRDKDRNRAILDVVAEDAASGHHVLVFSDRVDHCERMAKDLALERDTPCGVFLGGATNRKGFEDTKARIDEGRLRVACGTSCVYQGVDIPRLDVGVVTTPTASNKQLLKQQVGRLRRRFPGKTRGVLHYFLDARIFPSHLDLLRRYFKDRVTVAGG